MDGKDKLIHELQQKVCRLESRVEYLQGVLDESSIPYETNQPKEVLMNIDFTEENQGVRILSEVITQNHAKYFYSMFKGRMDVYSKRGGKPNSKSGKTGYYTQCWNFWKDGICPKKNGNKIRCGECKNQNYKPLSGENIMNHLNGERDDCSDVIGLYPMFLDETCNFLVFDFDNHNEKTNGEDFANTDNERTCSLFIRKIKRKCRSHFLIAGRKKCQRARFNKTTNEGSTGKRNNCTCSNWTIYWRRVQLSKA